MKSLSPPTMTKALMWGCVNAISSASSARLMSAPFLSPPGVRLRCTILMACCVSAAAVAAGALPVAVGGLRDDLAALLERLEHEARVEGGVQGVLDANFDVVEIDEYGKSESISRGSRSAGDSYAHSIIPRACDAGRAPVQHPLITS